MGSNARLRLPTMRMPLRNEQERAAAHEKIRISVNTIYKYHEHIGDVARRDLMKFAIELLLKACFRIK